MKKYIDKSPEVSEPRETVAEVPHARGGKVRPIVYLNMDGQIKPVEGQVVRTEEQRIIIEYQAGTDARVTKTRIVTKELFERWQRQAPKY
jgi:hypothetical protein